MKHLKRLGMYVLARRGTLVPVLLVWLTCAVVYFAYGLPLEPILYAMLLGAVLLLPLFLVDFSRFVYRHVLLEGICKTIGADLRQLPPATNGIEQDYQEIIRCIDAEKTRLVSQGDIRNKEAQEYYTLWVHQIKTPIAAAGLMLQAAAHPAAQRVQGELLQIEQYADMALNYTRMESIHNDLELRHYALDDIVRRSLKKLSRLFLLKKIAVHFQETNTTVLTDEKWLAFIIEQLLSNALKYSSSGTISVFLEADKGKTLVIADQGMGIRQEDLPRVFEKGFTGYNGRQDKKSSGIGLYMCKKVADVLSHGIAIASATAKGTCVRLHLDTIALKTE